MTGEEIEMFAKSNGHPPVADGVVCVDFDGTIAPWGSLFGYPKPLPSAVEFIDWLKEKGYTVVIFTSRLSSVWHAAEGRSPAKGIFEQVDYLQEYCRRYNINVDSATAEKIPAIAYIDDKAVEFLDWPKAARRFKRKVKG